MRTRVWTVIKTLLITMAAGLILSRSTFQANNTVESVRRYTRSIEFDYVNWTIQSLFIKNKSTSLGLNRYLSDEEGREIVNAYFRQVDEINALRSEISAIYADPEITDPGKMAEDANRRLAEMEDENKQMAALCETVLQQQVSTVAAEMGLSAGGQLIPPLLYHVTPLPMALIVSPRDTIRQDADISLLADLSLEDIVDLEQHIEQEMDVSALVVNIGGVGIYPTMVLRSTDLSWMIETIAHEWVHNFLTLRPMGMLYESTPEMRTMNETTANLAGKEIALRVYERFYPQFVPQETTGDEENPAEETAEPPEFDYRAEMHETRVTVDQLLQDGKIGEAEQYMETRRLFFREHGYQIRRINQAYFAFYGAYADEPGGQAGEDPVGPAVRKLRQQSDSLAKFLNRISWMTSFDNLQKEVSGGQ
ncbi:MAG: hypothetical protein LLG42_13200 [Chloroflexi bacterium]|nr:hypothetical protein [Chloroflexota bacterium]